MPWSFGAFPEEAIFEVPDELRVAMLLFYTNDVMSHIGKIAVSIEITTMRNPASALPAHR